MVRQPRLALRWRTRRSRRSGRRPEGYLSLQRQWARSFIGTLAGEHRLRPRNGHAGLACGHCRLDGAQVRCLLRRHVGQDDLRLVRSELADERDLRYDLGPAGRPARPAGLDGRGLRADLECEVARRQCRRVNAVSDAPVHRAPIVHWARSPSARGPRGIHAGSMTNDEPAGGSAPHTFLTTSAQSAGLAGKVQLRAGTPDTVLAVVPHMLGFYPSRSLVVLGLGPQNRVVVTFRYDLPDPVDYEIADDIAQHACYVLGRERISAALLVGYGPEELVAPVVASTARHLIGNGVDVHEVLRADSGRYWSMLCDDACCCPLEGRSYDPGSHPAAAALTNAGLSAHPDREALVRTVQRRAGSADRIRRATLAAQLRLSELVDYGEAAGDRVPQLR